MSNLWYPRKESPMLGLMGMGGGVASLMWTGATGDGPFSLWAFGSNENGMLAQNNSASSASHYSSPRQIPGEWQKLAGGEPYNKSMAAIKADGTLWSWGYNNVGQLGNGGPNPQRSSPAQVGTNTNWANVSTHTYGFIATKTDGTLWSWGYNKAGMLGHNQSGNEYSSPKQIGTGTDWGIESYHMTGGYNQCAAIKTNGTMWKWGQNNEGQLGHNNRTRYSSPTQVGTGTDWAGVADGQGNCFRAVKTDGTGWSCGANDQGQASFPAPTGKLSSPTQLGWDYTSFLPTSNLCASTGIQAYGRSPSENFYSVYVTGYNAQGGLGQNNTTNGTNGLGSLALTVGSPSNWKDYSMDTAERFMGGVRGDGTLWMWGNGGYGQLGLNNTTNYSSPKQVGTNTDWWQLKCGANSSFVLRNNL
tara:strand:+ start:47 stop:1294 length:1248 start_codon:yes stop_codon:yes gene_type:complete